MIDFDEFMKNVFSRGGDHKHEHNNGKFQFGDVVRVRPCAALVMKDKGNYSMSLHADEGQIGIVVHATKDSVIVVCRSVCEYQGVVGFNWDAECLEKIGRMTDLLMYYQISSKKEN